MKSMWNVEVEIIPAILGQFKP